MQTKKPNSGGLQSVAEGRVRLGGRWLLYRNSRVSGRRPQLRYGVPPWRRSVLRSSLPVPFRPTLVYPVRRPRPGGILLDDDLFPTFVPYDFCQAC